MPRRIRRNRWGQLRAYMRLDQEEFAAIVGTSRSTISRLEQGKTDLSYEQIERLEEYLGVSVSVMLGKDNQPPDWLQDYFKLPIKARRAAGDIIRATIRALS